MCDKDATWCDRGAAPAEIRRTAFTSVAYESRALGSCKAVGALGRIWYSR